MYMAKLRGTHMGADGQMHTYVNVCQSIEPVAGKTYIFSCDYYARTSDSGGSILLWSNTSKGDPGDPYGRFRCRTKPGEEGTLTLTYTATQEDTLIGLSMECDPESMCYLWNFCFRELDSDCNLLKNPNFATGEGSWIGWSVRSTDIQTEEDSKQVAKAYGHEIVAFDRELLRSMKEKDASVKDYDDPNSQPYIQTGGADTEANILREAIRHAKDDWKYQGGKTYYISSLHGDDGHAGTSPEEAWKTIAAYRANIEHMKAGDRVLFERGGTYRGEIRERTILPLLSGVTYGAYGEGVKPAIYGSGENYSDVKFWSRTDTKNIWVCHAKLQSDVGVIVFNHGEKVGIKRLKASEDLETNLAQLKGEYEFYHDLDTATLYLYLEDSPYKAFEDIELCEDSYLVLGVSDSHDIKIDNLCIKYGGGHAIRFHPRAKGITISNCEIGYLGGSLQQGTIRYGNGIEFWNDCSDISIENNWIYQIYDAGVTHQGGDIGGYVQQNITVCNNLVEYCCYALEFWAGNPMKDLLKNILYENNIIRFTGYGWGKIRSSMFGVAAINTWGHTDTFVAESFMVRNNIFDMSSKSLIVQYYAKKPNVTYIGNSYYLKEGNVALWTGKMLLTAIDQKTMEESVAKLDKKPKQVKFIERKEETNL